jgi:hypothetical protein
VKVGDNVEVTYHDTNGTLHAAKIRAVASAGRHRGRSCPQIVQRHGQVRLGTSLSISGSSGGGATFDQTFTIDSKTKSSAAAPARRRQAAGGKVAITDLVAAGDKVSVSFHDMGGTLHASEVRVTAKAAPSK